MASSTLGVWRLFAVISMFASAFETPRSWIHDPRMCLCWETFPLRRRYVRYTVAMCIHCGGPTLTHSFQAQVLEQLAGLQDLMRSDWSSMPAVHLWHGSRPEGAWVKGCPALQLDDALDQVEDGTHAILILCDPLNFLDDPDARTAAQQFALWGDGRNVNVIAIQDVTDTNSLPSPKVGARSCVSRAEISNLSSL